MYGNLADAMLTVTPSRRHP